MDSARNKTLAWRYSKHEYDSYRYSGKSRWESCRMDGTGKRSTVREFSVEVGSRYGRSQRGFGGVEINERLRPQTGGVNEQCALRRYLGTSRTFKARSKSYHCGCDDCAESAGTIAISPSTCA